MKKKILVLIILLLSYTNVYAITSNEVTYNNDTLTNKLDELMEELNMCKLVGTAKADEILKDKTAYVGGSLITGTIESIGTTTYTPGVSDQTISKKQYLSGNITIKGDSDLKQSNIQCGVDIFGVTGTNNCDSIICKRATTLHTATCNSDSDAGCQAAGLSIGDTITFGQLGTKGSSGLTPGDAFDCDVNGDGTYDPDTERFYYVSDYYNTISNTFDSNYATLVYYSNVSNGSPSNSNYYAYDSENTNYNGPRTAIEQLPKTTDWKNVSLKTTSRKIVNEQGGEITNNGSYTMANPYSYDGRAARLLTYQELTSGCSNASTLTIGSLDSCTYLMENTYYQNSSMFYYWLETPYSGHSNNVWYVNGYYRYVYIYYNANNSLGVRPAIDVLKSNISY